MVVKRHRHPRPSDEIDTNESWMRTYWRPMMGWTYMVICLFDFIIAPTGTAFLITFFKSTMPVWQSLTLSNGGVMHLAFGAILGVSAWGRTKESVTNTQFGPYGNSTTVVDTQTDVVVPRAQNPRPQPNQNVAVPPPRRPPVID